MRGAIGQLASAKHIIYKIILINGDATDAHPTFAHPKLDKLQMLTRRLLPLDICSCDICSLSSDVDDTCPLWGVICSCDICPPDTCPPDICSPYMRHLLTL